MSIYIDLVLTKYILIRLFVWVAVLHITNCKFNHTLTIAWSRVTGAFALPHQNVTVRSAQLYLHFAHLISHTEFENLTKITMQVPEQ